MMWLTIIVVAGFILMGVALMTPDKPEPMDVIARNIGYGLATRCKDLEAGYAQMGEDVGNLLDRAESLEKSAEGAEGAEKRAERRFEERISGLRARVGNLERETERDDTALVVGAREAGNKLANHEARLQSIEKRLYHLAHRTWKMDGGTE